jgi:hypothetical protein
MMISRTWMCLNRACRAQFHSYEANPACSECGCVKVQWVPGGGHIAKNGGVDRTVRHLADVYGMSDINSPSPSRLNRAAPKVVQPPVDVSAPPMQFAPGFTAHVSPHGATCAPSTTGVHARISASPGTALTGSKSVPGPRANTVIVASHQPAPR